MAEKLVSSSVHFFRSDDFLICLVCNKSISGQTNFDIDSILSSHIKAKGHQENVYALFTFCIPEWNGSHVDIVKNLVFDVTIMKNESSYVSKFGNHLVCSVCEESIVLCSDTKESKTTYVINHLNSTSHLNKLKNDVSWVYCLEDKFTFIIFYKSVAYCSICKIEVQSSKTCPVENVVEHFEAHHPNKMLKDVQIKDINESKHSKDSSTDEESLSSSFKMLNLSEISNKFEDFVESTNESSIIEENSSMLVNLHKDTFTCSECGKSITIYNENIGFSVDLHMQTHKSLSSVKTDSSLNYQEDADYVCPICQETIQIFNKDLDFSFNLHVENNHQLEKFVSEDVEAKNKFNFLNRVFDDLPESMREQRGVFMMDGNEVICKLCNCLLSSTKRIPGACKVFMEHMLNSFHVDQYSAMTELKTEAINVQMLSPKEKNQLNNQLENLAKKSPMIERNKQFLKKQRKNYFCTICDKQICYSPKEDTHMSNFASHLKSYLHGTLLTKIMKQESNRKCDTSSYFKIGIGSKSGSDLVKALDSKCLSQSQKSKRKDFFENVSKKSLLIEANKHFIEIEKNNFVCTICEKLINYSPKEGTQILNFVTHFNGKHHEKSLKKSKRTEESTKTDLTSNLKGESSIKSNLDSRPKCLSQSKKSEGDNVFENVSKKNLIIEANKHFIEIERNNFFCTICEKCINFSPQEDIQIFNFVSHLNGKSHEKSLKKIKGLRKTPKLM